MTKKRYLKPEVDDLQLPAANAGRWDLLQSCKVGETVGAVCHPGAIADSPAGCKSGGVPGPQGSFYSDGPGTAP